MMRLLQWLIFGHVHSWSIVKSGRLYDEGAKSGDLAIGEWYIRECTECKKRKYTELVQ